jgi:hypothetical protein
MSKFTVNTRVSLDYDKGTVLYALPDGSKAIIQWDSDMEKEEWDAETFFDKGEGKNI